ncbi:MAG: amidohydrolase [Colwellia sp. Phe_37]|jgi:reactive intermediate/imine deaminase|nr:MAG: amidohydrolase [Colwellia sp. Phe_37]
MTPFKRISLLTISMSFALPVFAQTFALKNINIVDVEGLKIDNNQTVVIENDSIKSITATNKQRLSKDVVVLDMTDKYLIPGLIDTHVHHATSPDSGDNDQVTRMRLRKLLQGGVTSVRDMGGDTRALYSLKRRADNDVIQSPDIYYSVIIGGDEFFSDPRTVESAKGEIPGQVNWMRAVDEDSPFDEIMLKASGAGATGIKIYAKVSASVIPKLAAAAKKHGLKVWSHAFVGPARPQQLVNAGVETISHAPDLSAHVVDNFYQLRRENKHITEKQKAESFQLDSYQNLFDDMKKNQTILDATLTVFEKQKVARGERGELMYQWGNTFTRMAHANGIKISAGTDGTSDYYQSAYPLVQHEMQLLVNDVGMTPLEAIQAATINGAKVIGIEQSHGAIRAGKVANLVILNDNPSENIENVTDIAHVIKNGQFVHIGDDKSLPFVSAKKAGGMLWMSGQIGNFPSTKTLVGPDVSSQMQQAMKNIGSVLQSYDLDYRDIAKCTLMLADIDDWQAANNAYLPFFETPPARSAYAAAGLALNAKVEVECIAEL